MSRLRLWRWWLTAAKLSAGALFAGLVVVGASVLASAQTLSWSIVPSPNSAGVDFLQAVSCASTTACMAVGFSNTSTGGYSTLVESWDGTSWSIVPSPDPSAGTSYLRGVTCVSPIQCTAVGWAGGRTLIESWDGTSWSVVPSPDLASDEANLYSVSCPSATACTAVGNSSDKPLIESWDGTSWSVVPNPGSGASYLYGVSCASVTACMAVGNHASKTFAESWDGTSWTVVPSPDRHGKANVFENVSCTSATACWAAGVYYPHTTSIGATLTESWDGTSWSVVPSPSPAASSGDTLADVSCTSATACTAAGYRGSSGVYETLIESWDGTSWTVVPSPDQGSISSSFAGVSCASATACTAAGTYYVQTSGVDMGQTLIELGTASG
jgi:hypothetical protein